MKDFTELYLTQVQEDVYYHSPHIILFRSFESSSSTKLHKTYYCQQYRIDHNVAILLTFKLGEIMYTHTFIVVEHLSDAFINSFDLITQ